MGVSERVNSRVWRGGVDDRRRGGMKLTVKTLKGSHFEIRVQPSDTVSNISHSNFSFTFTLSHLILSYSTHLHHYISGVFSIQSTTTMLYNVKLLLLHEGSFKFCFLLADIALLFISLSDYGCQEKY